MVSTQSRAAARRRLLGWYRRHRRSLPWRQSANPYHVLVSEIMLQQTRVSAVIPYYQRFLRRFPTFDALAAASVEDVLTVWSGLGYYGRARRLQEAARIIVKKYAGEFPLVPAVVRELPGIGRYTAGAVLSIAFGQPEPVVDGNVSRVLSRLYGIEGDLRSAKLTRRLWEEAAAFLDPRHPGDFNQAVMELGATLCLPAQPECPRCPLQRHCEAYASGRQAELPTPQRRTPTRSVRAAAVVLRRGDRVLLVQRREKGLLQGLWEFPWVEGADALPARVPAALRRSYRLLVELGEGLGEVRHGILQRRFQVLVHSGRLVKAPSRTAPRGPWRWVEAHDPQIPLAASARKIMKLLSQQRRSSADKRAGTAA